MRRFFTILVITAGSLFLLYKLLYPTFTWHQKLTVTVETPHGIKTGSAVTRVRVWFQPSVLPEGAGAGDDVQGEATIIEVAPGKYLFALLGNEKDMAYNLYKAGQKGKQPTWAEVFEVLRKQKGVPKSSMPFVYQKFVTFTDINDPTTVAEVDPTNLAATFGDGYALKDVAIESTDESVTDGKVEMLLNWLVSVGKERSSLKGRPDKGLVSNQPDAAIYMITPTDFSTELYK